ncbi:hypothetical protein LOTGIDRAFT_157025 [Lottia gigantea]|uniref:Uncharacterized protein n=1 Tax=Lottia gigantea TaxID=225164 RepID=V4AG94_LOTGI|nr:hypothetical protein LOTGIDRAFT_157025 [Lottia gigantea]ESP03064.1 hypothetical protein LOTGIDRAFT_157025 [Lottia gigantea]
MANKFGLGSLPLESKNHMSSTSFINKAKPFFVDQIGDTLQGDIDMNNFKITNLKFPGNDNDAVNKKYLLDQINAIQIDKDHVENRINDVKRFIRRNIKNLVDEPKLQQELTSLKRLIQVDKTSQLQNLISKLDDKITKVKIDVQRLIDNPNVNEDRLKRKLTALERKLAELDKTADKTEVQNSISNLNEKIAKQKSDVQDIINTLPIDKDTLKRQLSALDTKITDELEKEVGVIKNFLQNKFRDDMKNYIKEQVNLLVSRIHDDFLRQERKLSKLEAIVTDKSYYFNLPFERKDQIYKSNKYGFKAEIKVGSLAYGEPKNVFDIGETQEFSFRGNCLIQIEFPMKVKVNKVVFKQTGKGVKHISLFNDGNLEENIRLIDKRDQEIETKNGKYVDTFKMEVENDKDIIGIKDLDIILETENPPLTNIVKIPPSLIIPVYVPGPIESSSHEFLRTTDFEYVKLYFVLGGKYTSIDVHKSQQEREFIIHLSFAEGSDSILEGGGFISRAKINIEKEKIIYSYHLKEDHTKKEMSQCFIKCVNRVLNKDLTCKFQEYINGFSKANRKRVMTCARMNEFNKKFNTSFQIYNPKNRHFHPRDVHDELDWVLYLHNSHFCLIRRSQKSLGIQEIEDNYEQVWKTCRDDNAVTQVSPLKLHVLSSMSDDALFAWDCETYSEKETRRAIPYACTLINLEKLRKMLNRINNLFPDLKPSDPIPEEFTTNS